MLLSSHNTIILEVFILKYIMLTVSNIIFTLPQKAFKTHVYYSIDILQNYGVMEIYYEKETTFIDLP